MEYYHTHHIFLVSYYKQKILLKEYPSKLLFTTIQCIFSSIQSFIVAILSERDIAQWKLHFNMRLLAVAYSVNKSDQEYFINLVKHFLDVFINY